MKVRQFFNNAKKWIKGEWEDSATGACCLEGAINKCYTDFTQRSRIYNKVSSYLRKYRHNACIPEYNDHPRRTFKDIKRLVIKLDI